ncbi:MAG: AbrB/MazE/SpoVT family DNA-binding domain-containing protein [Dehalococcoidia bacterium]
MNTLVRHRTRIGKRNQVTIPAATLRRMGLKPGDRVDIVEEADGVVRIETVRQWVERTAGMLHRAGTPALSIEELEAEIKRARTEAATASHLRFLAEHDRE